MKKILSVLFILILTSGHIHVQGCLGVTQKDPDSLVICSGSSVTLTLAKAEGGNDSNKYLWQESTDGKVWTDVKENGTSPDYTTPVLTSTMYYRRKVSNGCDLTNSHTTKPAMITMLEEMEIVSHPEDQVICYNNRPDSLFFIVTGGNNLKYRWEESLDGIGDWTDVDQSPEDPAGVLTPGALLVTTYYRCTVTSNPDCGKDSLTSRVVKIAISEDFLITGYSPDQAICNNTQPDPLYVTVSEGFSVTYQWQVSTNKSDWSDIAGATESTYDPGVLTATRYYRCIVGSEKGCENTIESGIMTVTILSELNIISHPESQTICNNSRPEPLRVAATAGATVFYQWQKDRQDIAGATQQTYQPDALTQRAAYRCVVTDECGNTAISEEAIVTLYPEFKAGSIVSGEQVICSGVQPQLIGSGATASGGDGQVSYRWFRNGVVIAGASGESLSPASFEASGEYVFTREAKDGTCSDWVLSEGSFSFTVNPVPTAPQRPNGNDVRFCKEEGKITEYETNILADAAGYVWELLPSAAGRIIGSGNKISVEWSGDFAGTATLKVKAISECDVQSGFSPELSIEILNAPDVDFVEFTASVCGNQKEVVYSVEYHEGMTYQWSVENGTIKSGAGESEIVVDWNKITTEQATGKVSVVVTSREGCSQSLSGSVSLKNNAPDINAVAAKINTKGEPYILIYPNPAESYTYQWYRNGVPVSGETEQFYYLPGGLGDAEYKVLVSDPELAECGTFAYYEPSGETPLRSDELFIVYPNPNEGNFSVSINTELLDSDSEDLVFTLYTFSGMKIAVQKAQKAGVTDFNRNLSQGNYFISLSVDGKEKFSKKIVVR